MLRLRALRNDEGSYKEAEDQSTSAKLLNIFSVLMGNLTDDEALTYRDDALAHYLTGITFEFQHGHLLWRWYVPGHGAAEWPWRGN